MSRSASRVEDRLGAAPRRRGAAAAREVAAVFGQREDGDRVLAGVGHEQAAAVARHRQRGRRRPDALGAADRQRALHAHVLGVEHRDQVLVGDGDVGAVLLGIDRDRLRVRQVRADRDRLDHLAALEVDHADRAVDLVGDEAVLAVVGDRRAVRVAADLHVADGLGLGVDDRGVVGEVERHEQRGAVARDGDVARRRYGDAFSVSSSASRRRW